MIKFINGNLYIEDQIFKKDFLINDENKIILSNINKFDNKVSVIYNLEGLTVLPGFVDIHIHTRNPGYSNKATWQDINKSLLYGGFTHALAQSNILPEPNTKRKLNKIQKLLDQNLDSNVIQVGKITKKNHTITKTSYWKTVKFISDDGFPVIKKTQMHKALKLSKKYNVQMLLHEQDVKIKGYSYQSNFATKSNIQSFDSLYETNLIKRDIDLNKKINAKIHIQHISTLEGLIMYEKAKSQNMNITIEVTPHHLILDNSLININDANFKVNPPISTPQSKKVLVEALRNKVIQIIATDHAPHSSKDKEGGFEKGAFGFVGLESSFGLMRKLSIIENISLTSLVNAMSINPAKLINVDNSITENNIANLTIVNLNKKWFFDKSTIKSKNYNSPFIGNELVGKVEKVIINGKLFDLYNQKKHN